MDILWNLVLIVNQIGYEEGYYQCTNQMSFAKVLFERLACPKFFPNVLKLLLLEKTNILRLKTL